MPKPLNPKRDECIIQLANLLSMVNTDMSTESMLFNTGMTRFDALSVLVEILKSSRSPKELVKCLVDESVLNELEDEYETRLNKLSQSEHCRRLRVERQIIRDSKSSSLVGSNND